MRARPGSHCCDLVRAQCGEGSTWVNAAARDREDHRGGSILLRLDGRVEQIRALGDHITLADDSLAGWSIWNHAAASPVVVPPLKVTAAFSAVHS